MDVMLHLSLVLLIVALLDTSCVNAVILPFRVHVHKTQLPLPTRNSATLLTKRYLRGRQASVNLGNGSIPVANTFNSQYISNITLGGRTIPVLLDTGRCVTLVYFYFVSVLT